MKNTSHKLPKREFSNNFLEFFDWACEYFEKHGKKIDIRDTTYVVANGRCGGYCDETGIVVAGRCEDFEEVLGHEVIHCHQIVENSPLWTDENWWEGKFDIPHFLKILNLMALERDCEERVLELNKKWKLFDEKRYIKKANACLLSYHIMFLNRSWSMTSSIYDEKILEIVPDKLLSLKQLRNIDMVLIAQINHLLGK